MTYVDIMQNKFIVLFMFKILNIIAFKHEILALSFFMENYSDLLVLNRFTCQFINKYIQSDSHF